MAFTFKKATKVEARARIAIIGPTGSGKTFTVLRMLAAMTSNFAIIDSERKSASKYVGEKNPDGGKKRLDGTIIEDRFQFDVLELETHHPDNYIAAMEAAEEAGYQALGIDSLSHAWMGKEGALEQLDAAARRSQSGNQFAAWKDVTPMHNRLVDKLLNCKYHLVCTLRAKMEYVIEKDEKTGKATPKKIGMAPQMRDGIEYEFDVSGDMTVDHFYSISKTRCSALDKKTYEKPGFDVANLVLRWLTDGAVPLDQALKQELADLQVETLKLADGVTEWEGKEWRATKFDPYYEKVKGDLTKLQAAHKMLSEKKRPQASIEEEAKKALEGLDAAIDDRSHLSRHLQDTSGT